MWNLNNYLLWQTQVERKPACSWSEVAACSGSRNGATEYVVRLVLRVMPDGVH